MNLMKKHFLAAAALALASMASVSAQAADIVDTAVAAGNFKTLVTALKAAGLVDEKGLRFSINDRATGQPRFRATRSDLIFGANSQLRAVAEVYAASDGHARFVHDFVSVWNKVMMLDRFDVRVQDR